MEQPLRARSERGRRFWHITAAGTFFQGGAAAVDTGTIIAALVHLLTGGSAFRRPPEHDIRFLEQVDQPARRERTEALNVSTARVA